MVGIYVHIFLHLAQTVGFERSLCEMWINKRIRPEKAAILGVHVQAVGPRVVFQGVLVLKHRSVFQSDPLEFGTTKSLKSWSIYRNILLKMILMKDGSAEYFPRASSQLDNPIC